MSVKAQARGGVGSFQLPRSPAVSVRSTDVLRQGGLHSTCSTSYNSQGYIAIQTLIVGESIAEKWQINHRVAVDLRLAWMAQKKERNLRKRKVVEENEDPAQEEGVDVR